jgi:hypothetical protein
LLASFVRAATWTRDAGDLLNELGGWEAGLAQPIESLRHWWRPKAGSRALTHRTCWGTDGVPTRCGLKVEGACAFVLRALCARGRVPRVKNERLCGRSSVLVVRKPVACRGSWQRRWQRRWQRWGGHGTSAESRLDYTFDMEDSESVCCWCHHGGGAPGSRSR